TTIPLINTYRDWLQSLYDSGSDVSGPVRYSILDASNDYWFMGHTDVAFPWPFPNDPSSNALSVQEDRATEPQIAAGQDADALRAVRAAYVQSNGPFDSWRMPMAATTGGITHYFDVAMRDVIPFEVDGAINPDAFFQ